jgi:hypothetical protein
MYDCAPIVVLFRVRSTTYSVRTLLSFLPERFFGWFVACAQVSFSTGAGSSTAEGTLSTRHPLLNTTLLVARLVLVLVRVLVLELRLAVQERDLPRRPLLFPFLPRKRCLSYRTRLELAA